MKKIVRVLAACAIALSAQSAWATPSTVFWTPATTYIQPFLMPHLGMDVYFNDKANYPINVGLTMGVLPFEKIQAEVGLDFFFPYWGPQNAVFLSPAGALQLNAKVGTPEGSFAEWSPGISGGIYGVGLNQATQFSILHAEVGKTFFFGNLTAGGYYGAGGVGALWSDVDGVAGHPRRLHRLLHVARLRLRPEGALQDQLLRRHPDRQQRVLALRPGASASTSRPPSTSSPAPSSS